MKKLTFCILSGDKQQDAFMHAMDAFEPSKSLATSTIIEAEVADNYNTKALISRLKDGCEKVGQRVTAIISIDHPKFSYVDRGVISISDGKKWGPLSQYLNHYGVPPENDQ